MSSKPSQNGVDDLRLLLAERKSLGDQILSIRSQVEQLERLEERQRIVSRDIIKKLEDMDCKADGNAGWEGRMVWMLTELMTQVIEKPRP